MVRLKCNFIPAHGSPGEKVQVNLQTGVGKGPGAGNILHQPSMNLCARFDTNILVLTIIQTTHAVSFIHSSLVNPQGLLLITMLIACYQTFNYYALIRKYKHYWVLIKNIIFSYGVGY